MAIVIAAVIQMVVGFLWYSPMLFGNAWMKMSGIKMDQKQKPDMMMPMVWMFLGTLVLSFVLSGFVGYAGAKGLVDGAFVGVMAWIGFIATTTVHTVLFENKPFKLYLLNNGHYLVGLALAGAVLGYFA
ncbi:DUF1761 domain-containing protein [Candidatus Micrarchaeota archaeon]|nr:DUF1761 domain-containing protein [Candidatus Micrarchaeota archaeon]